MESKAASNTDATPPEFLSGGGEMGALIRSKDWSKTPLGAPEIWPQSLRTTVSTCLNSRFPILIWWGPKLVMIYNDAYRPILGSKHPASMGKEGKTVWPEVWDIIGPMLYGVYEQGISTWSENQLLLLERNGYPEECYFTFSYSPIHVENGGVGGVFCAVTETTQTVLNERQSKTIQELSNLEIVYKTVDEVYLAAAKVLEKNKHDFPFGMIYKIEKEGTVANPIAYAGLNKEQKVFPNTINLIRPKEGTLNLYKAFQTKSIVLSANNGRRRNLSKGAWEKEATHFIHVPIIHPGSKYPHAILSAALNPHRNFDENFKQFTKLIADQIALEISNVIVYEEERKRAAALAEIDKAKTLFYSNVSHEFRTPLTLILGSLEEWLAKKTAISEADNKVFIETAHHNAMRLLRLVNNLLDFSRIEAGRVKARYQRIDLARYTTDLASNFRSVVENAGLSFTIQTEALIEPVYVDKEMWEKIVLNLIFNAFKYTLQGGITVSLTTERDRVMLKVKDTGVGIPESELSKMFQRFHRIENAVGRTYEGTGIGLSLVSELVKLHGGDIHVNSRLGDGSEFIVSLPTGKLHLPHEQVIEKETEIDATLTDTFIEEARSLIEQSLAEPELKIKNDKLPTVLVVDDNADLREHLKAILKRHYNVITVNNGMEALHQAKIHSPHLIVSDIMMPVMDGNQLLKAIKEDIVTKNIPVLLLSARAGEEERIEGYEIGADDYLVKPFSAKELLARVKSQISIAQARQENEQMIKSFFMQAPAAIAVVHGPDHLYTIANPIYQKLFGRSKEQLIGYGIKQIWPEVEGQGIYELFDQVFTTGEPFIAHEFPASFSENGILKNGLYEFVAQPIKNNEGKVTDIMIHAFEVTEQVHAKKLLLESEQQLKFAIEATELGTWDLDPVTNKFTGNNRLKEWFGLEPEEEIQLPLALAAIAEKDREKVGNAMQRALQFSSGGNYDVVYSIIHPKTKKERIVRAKGKSSFNEEGIAYRFNGTLQDVTEETAARKALVESEELLRIALEGGELGTYDFYPQTGELIWSAKTKELFGLPPEAEISYDLFSRALHPGDRERANAALQRAINTNHSDLYENEYRTVGITDGRLRWIRSKAKISVDASGKTLRLTGVVQDVTKQKEILASLQLQSLVLNKMEEGVSVSDEKGYIILTNPAEDNMFGYDPGELVGKHVTIQNAYSPGENEKIVSNVITELKQKGFWNGEWHNRKKDGTDFYTYSFITSTILDGQTLFVCVQRDITEEKTVREKLAYRTALLEAQNEAIPDAILIVDTKGKMLSFNQRFIDLWKIPHDIIERKDDTAALAYAMKQLIHPEAFMERVNYLYAHPEEKAHEEVLFKDGRIIERYGNPVLGEARETYGWAWYFRDVTEQKKAEEQIRLIKEQLENKVKERTRELAAVNKALRIQNETFKQAEESSGQGSYSFNLTTGALDYSDSLYKLLGYEPEAFPPSLEEFNRHVHPDDRDYVMKAAEKVLQKQHADDWRYRMIKKNGEVIHIKGTGRIIGSNNDLLLVGTLQNITTDVLLKQTLQTKNRELERSNEDLQQFAHVASHDLKEPLRKIKTFSSRLKSEFGASLPEKGNMYLDKIETASNRMYAMIDGVLLYSSISEGQLLNDTIDLNELIKNVESDLEVIIQQKEARLLYSNLPVIKGSGILIQQLFYNLINNSLKFSSTNKKLLIQIHSKIVSANELSHRSSLPSNQKYVHIKVQDNGIGFKQSESEKIFKTFTRLNSKDKYEGTGLGLALCKKIVERHEGSIYAESNEGEGATFTIILPVD